MASVTSSTKSNIPIVNLYKNIPSVQLNKAFQYLPLIDISNAARTCKNWRDTSREESLFAVLLGRNLLYKIFLKQNPDRRLSTNRLTFINLRSIEFFQRVLPHTVFDTTARTPLPANLLNPKNTNHLRVDPEMFLVDNAMFDLLPSGITLSTILTRESAKLMVVRIKTPLSLLPERRWHAIDFFKKFSKEFSDDQIKTMTEKVYYSCTIILFPNGDIRIVTGQKGTSGHNLLDGAGTHSMNYSPIPYMNREPLNDERRNEIRDLINPPQITKMDRIYYKLPKVHPVCKLISVMLFGISIMLVITLIRDRNRGF